MSTSDIERFNRWAATYDRSIAQTLLFGPVHSRMLNLLELEPVKASPACILDIGCGTGRLLRAASKRWPKAQLVGIDPAEQMISVAIRMNPDARFTVATAESIPLPDHSVDIVLSSLSFHHWSDQKKAFLEIARVLRPDGLFCLADHTLLPARLLGEKVKTRGRIRAMLAAAGFSIRREHSLRSRFVFIILVSPSLSSQPDEERT